MHIQCPSANCHEKNQAGESRCLRCGTPLTEYARLFFYPNILYNQGLSAARKGDTRRARDLFSAVVHWCPMDVEARAALAMACYELKDLEEARSQWETVLKRKPADTLAAKGLSLIQKSLNRKKRNITKKRQKKKK